LAAVKDFSPAAGRTFELGFSSRQHLSIVTMGHQKIETLPSTSSRSYPVKERKLSLAKIIGLSGFVASVNTIAIRVVSAATTNGPRSFRKPPTSASAAFCWSDFFVISDMPRVY